MSEKMVRKQRGRSWRRFQNFKIIRKRQNIIKNFWNDDSYNTLPGMLRKWNFTCSCGMCRMSKYYDKIEKHCREDARARKISDYF